MRRLIIGGARSGKSRFAESLLANGPTEYVATSWADPSDAEWAARVRTHVARRPASWSTTETIDVAAVLARVAPEPMLVDCLTLWLSRVMDECGCWPDIATLNPPAPDPPERYFARSSAADFSEPVTAPTTRTLDGEAAVALASRVDELVAAVTSTSRGVVLVTNEVGQGIVPATASGRLFRDAMGVLNLRVAAACDEVWLVTAGIPQRIKG